MLIAKTVGNLFENLVAILETMEEREFTGKLKVLNETSISSHSRHIYEFGECIISHNQGDILCYDERKRDLNLENSLSITLEKFYNIIQSLYTFNNNYNLKVKHFLGQAGEFITNSNMERELLFVLDHTIHHMAIIRIGLDTELPWIDIPKNFGFTPSTIRYNDLIKSS
ncbi:MAG: hypothetical protein KDK36_03410 [Leptospiraceae bacterium]|nr:hypothetical protein [Leptospiraceae bacterium]